MAKRSGNSTSGNDVLTLAPWVIAMRLPAMMYEMSTPWHATGLRRGGEGEKAVVEKTAAIVESYGTLQADVVEAWFGLLTNTMLGKAPDPLLFSRSIQDITDASLEPMAKRVRSNYLRLRRVHDSSVKKAIGSR